VSTITLGCHFSQRLFFCRACNYDDVCVPSLRVCVYMCVSDGIFCYMCVCVCRAVRPWSADKL